MNINLTLIVQMLVFIVLIWFTMKFVWPMILGPMEERAKKIAHGLAAADRGEEALSKARDEAETRPTLRRSTIIWRQRSTSTPSFAATSDSVGVRCSVEANSRVAASTCL